MEARTKTNAAKQKITPEESFSKLPTQHKWSNVDPCST